MHIVQIIGQFKGRLGEAMRYSTLVRPSGAEAGLFVILVNGGNPTGFFAPFTRITPAERRCGELIANESCLQDGDLVFPNILSYTHLASENCLFWEVVLH